MWACFFWSLLQYVQVFLHSQTEGWMLDENNSKTAQWNMSKPNTIWNQVKQVKKEFC